MKQVVLSAAARADLAAIAVYTRERWGDRQTETYLAKFKAEFKAGFKALAVMPNLGRPRDDLATSVRSILVGRHLVFYRQTVTRVTISRILHARQDIDAALDPTLDD
ncbi:MAG: type II toxin-antitoxin system RelE/ParE family toxin [Rhodospirillaceae bacterium]|nr:type II toxin-antitoxin system RelE/ParE family toxin [Rhodospirillaceae bacterium]